MAEGKKSFIAYADWIAQVDMLSDEEAGKLFRHLLLYVNDENPELGPDDRLIKIAFEPIRQQLKRDLNAWEDRKEAKKEGARLGNLKKYHPDIYAKVSKGQMSLDEAEKLAYPRTPSHSEDKSRIATDSEKNARIVSHSVAKLAVNDNVNDTVNVNVNVIEVEGEKEAATLLPTPLLNDQLYSLDKLTQECKDERYRSWVNLNCKQLELDYDYFISQISVFSEFLESEGVVTKTLKDFRSHFTRWIKKRVAVNHPQSAQKNDLSLDIEDQSKAPDNSGDWIWLNGKWRRISLMTDLQRKKLNI